MKILQAAGSGQRAETSVRALRSAIGIRHSALQRTYASRVFLARLAVVRDRQSFRPAHSIMFTHVPAIELGKFNSVEGAAYFRGTGFQPVGDVRVAFGRRPKSVIAQAKR